MPPTPELPEYRPLCTTAVAGLVLSLLSLAVLAEPQLWPLPLVGALTSFWALRLIVREKGAMSGRKLAWAGMLLSTAMAAAAPAQWFWYRHLLRREAIAAGRLWLELVAHGETYAAYRLTMNPATRPREQVMPPNMADDNPRFNEELRAFLARPVIEKLLAMGARAEIHAEQVLGQVNRLNRDSQQVFYRIELAENGRRQTLSVGLLVERVPYSQRRKDGERHGLAGWQIRPLEHDQQ